jgi:hypothetical protein
VNELIVDTVQTQVQAIAEAVKDMQEKLGVNDKGFYVLLAYHSNIGMKTCKQIIDSIFELEETYVKKNKDGG